MFCPKCQRPNEDTASYCLYCGASLSVPASQPPVQTPPLAVQPVVLPETPVVQPVQPETLPPHPVIGRIKALASSTVFLVAAIAFTLAAVFNIAASFTSQSALTGIMDEYYNDPYTEDELGDLWEDEGLSDGQVYGDEYGYYVEFGGDSVIAGMVPSIVVSGLTVAAIWMLYATGKNRRYPGMKTAGLTILQVMNVITLVLVGFIVLILLVFVLLFSASWDMIMEEALAGVEWTGDPMELYTMVTAVFIVLLAVIALMVAFMVFYQIKVILLINNTKKTVMSGVPVGKGSLFVAVMCYISGGLAALSAVASVLVTGVFGLLAGVAQATALIAFGMVAMRYRSLMQELQFVMNQPPAPYVIAQNYYGVPANGYAAPPAPPTFSVPATYAVPPAAPVVPTASVPSTAEPVAETANEPQE